MEECCELFTGPDALEAIMNETHNYLTEHTDDNESHELSLKRELKSTLEARVLHVEQINVRGQVSAAEGLRATMNKNTTQVYPYFDTSSNVKEKKRKNNGKKYLQCPHDWCKRMFRLEAFYKLHLLSHGDSGWECRLCGKAYRDKNQLARHEARHHCQDGKPKLFACQMPACGHTCYSFKLLRKHEMTQHNLKQRLFHCQRCDKSFFSKSTYFRHVNKHNALDQRKRFDCGKHFSFACDLCGLEFRRSTNLQRHRNVHRGKNFFCKICFATFSHRRSMTKHYIATHPIATNKWGIVVKSK